MSYLTLGACAVPRILIHYKSYYLSRRLISREEIGRYTAEAFVPERFLEEHPPLDPSLYAFGFGRRYVHGVLKRVDVSSSTHRLCPGKELGDNSMFILAATLLACFDILPPTNGSIPRAEWSTGTVRQVF